MLFRHILDLIDDLDTSDNNFISLTEGLDSGTNVGKLVLQIVAAVNEFELKLIRERTRAGMVAARRAGKKVGRKFALSPEEIRTAFVLVSDEEQPIASVARLFGVCHDTITRGFQRQGLAA